MTHDSPIFKYSLEFLKLCLVSVHCTFCYLIYLSRTLWNLKFTYSKVKITVTWFHKKLIVWWMIPKILLVKYINHHLWIYSTFQVFLSNKIPEKITLHLIFFLNSLFILPVFTPFLLLTAILGFFLRAAVVFVIWVPSLTLNGMYYSLDIVSVLFETQNNGLVACPYYKAEKRQMYVKLQISYLNLVFN